MSRFRDRAVSAAYGLGWSLVRTLPEPPTRAVFRLGADLGARRGGPGVHRLAGNLRRVVGPDVSDDALRDLVRAGLRSYARYWMEAFRLPEWDAAEIGRRFVLENVEELDRAVARGRGVVVALPHAGNWDLAGAWATLHGLPVTTVAERLRPEDLYRRFLDFRRSLGMEILPLTGGSRQPLDVLTERLRAGRLVVLLADRDLSARGVEVDFFGARATLPPGPAILALRTGAPLYGLALWNDPTTTRARLIGPIPVDADPEGARGLDRPVGSDQAPRGDEVLPGDGGPQGDGAPPVDGNSRVDGGRGPDPGRLVDRATVGTVVQRIADALASGIAEHPEDWHMLQPLWLDDLSPRRRRATSDGEAAAPTTTRPVG